MAKKTPVRYSENPFLNEGDVITTRKKNVLIGKGNDILLNQETGEVAATNIMAIREVDDDQFVKLFTKNIQLLLDLTAAGNKAFIFLLWAVQNTALGKDTVLLGNFELDGFLDTTNLKMSEPTMRRGLSELVNAKIIAHTKRKGCYFINPNFVFNGDRVRFITEIKRKSLEYSRLDSLEKQGQQRLID